MRTARLLLALSALALAGCFRMTIKNDQPAAAPNIEWEDRWHHGLVFGLAELSGPYDLSKICPQGWAEIHTETPFVQGLVTVLTSDIYTPQAVTVRCSARGR